MLSRVVRIGTVCGRRCILDTGKLICGSKTPVVCTPIGDTGQCLKFSQGFLRTSRTSPTTESVRPGAIHKVIGSTDGPSIIPQQSTTIGTVDCGCGGNSPCRIAIADGRLISAIPQQSTTMGAAVCGCGGNISYRIAVADGSCIIPCEPATIGVGVGGGGNVSCCIAAADGSSITPL